MVKNVKWIFLFLVLELPVIGWAWSGYGHRIVADIAYWHLTPQVRHEVNDLTKKMFANKSGLTRFEKAATWPDNLKNQDVNMFNEWHFINLPIVSDGVKPPPVQQENVAWATQQMEVTLTSHRATSFQRAIALAFLVHFVGDAHQPLHCACLYSHQFLPPAGDLGGNRYLIRSPLATNLHEFWDQGVGLFPNYSVTKQDVSTRKLANQFSEQFPAKTLQKQIQDLNPYHWSWQSHAIAYFAYTIPFDSEPTNAYIKQAQFEVKRQLILAGLRLANLLNQILGQYS